MYFRMGVVRYFEDECFMVVRTKYVDRVERLGHADLPFLANINKTLYTSQKIKLSLEYL
jgi:hypothetical protein